MQRNETKIHSLLFEELQKKSFECSYLWYESGFLFNITQVCIKFNMNQTYFRESLSSLN
mgnify:CR=1 FL=1